MVCGLVPGSIAVTVIVGKSTFGRSLTGNCRYATMPKTRMPTMTSVVMTGRLMKSDVKFIWRSRRHPACAVLPAAGASTGTDFARFTLRPSHAWNCSMYV